MSSNKPCCGSKGCDSHHHGGEAVAMEADTCETNEQFLIAFDQNQQEIVSTSCCNSSKPCNSGSSSCCAKEEKSNCCETKTCGKKKTCCATKAKNNEVEEESSCKSGCCSKQKSSCCDSPKECCNTKSCSTSKAHASSCCNNYGSTTCSSNNNSCCNTAATKQPCCSSPSCGDEHLHLLVDAPSDVPTNHKVNLASGSATCTMLNVQGLSCCSSCSKTIDDHLNKLSGVLQVKVYFLSEKVVCYHDKHVITADTLVEEISKLGYPTRIFEESTSNRVKIKIEQVNNSNSRSVDDALMGLKGVTNVSYAGNSTSNCYAVEYNPDVTGARTILETLESKYQIFASIEDQKHNVGATVQTRGSDSTQWRRGFLFSLIFTIPVVIISMVAPLIPQVDTLLNRVLFLKTITLKALLEFVLTTPIQFLIALPIYKSAYKALRFASANMDVLIAISTLAAYLYSIASVALAYFIESYKADFFFDTSAILITLVMLGRYLEAMAVGSTSNALSKLLSLQVSSATLFENECEREIDIALVQRKDILKVAPGARIPTDGFIVKGSTTIDESMVTGESLPVSKSVGDLVIGGTVNQTGMLLMQCTKTVSETTLSSIYKLVEEAQVAKTSVQRVADRIAAWFVPIILLIACLTFITWFLLAYFNALPVTLSSPLPPFPFALMFAMTVLVVSCPCAIALSAPTAIMVATGVAAKLGILFKSAAIMEILHKVDTLVFDKTGTLTMGKPSVTNVLTFNGMSEHDLLFYAAVAEKGFTNHVLGQAVIKHAQESNIILEEPTSCHSEAGKGIEATVRHQTVHLGNKAWMQDKHIKMDEQAIEAVTRLQDEAKTIILCAVNKKLTGVIALADTVKPEAATIVQALMKQKKKVVMLTGDNEQTAQAIASQIGIEHVFSQVLPANKAEKVKELQEGGKKIVLMIGDGINDSVALTQANIGVSIASGTDIAVEASDIVLMKSDLRDLLVAMDLAKTTFNRIKLNFVWAFIYNVIGIPFAAGAAFPFLHWQLSPALAGFSEVLSSIPVIISSLLLKLYSKPKI